MDEEKEEESMQKGIDKMREGEIDDLEEANLGEFIGNTTDKPPFVFAYQKATWDKPKKFTVIIRTFMHTLRLRATKEVWKDAEGDEKMFSYLFQLRTMKETFKSVNGMPCDTKFWEFMDDEWIENTRVIMFGPNPLEASPYSGADIKNLQTEFKSAIENLLSTEREKQERESLESKESG